MLRRSAVPLCETYDLGMLDLDGVVYIGSRAVDGAPERLAAARECGMHLAFITNNASRPPEAVAEHLTELGVDADAADVVTSAQAAARLLANSLPEGSRVLLLGGPGLEEALRERGLVSVTSLSDEPVAVVSGYGPDLRWRQIMQAAIRIRDGLPWVASNTDLSFPTAYGVGPGHGVLVRMMTEFTGVTPRVAGKPERPLLDETVARVGGDRPLMVGDRLDTDILGAHRAGIDSLLVLTGVTGVAELAAAVPEERPSFLATDLSGLLNRHPAVPAPDAGEPCVVGGWSASVERGRIAVDGSGAADDWWRAVAVAAWAHADRAGQPAEVDGLEPPVPDDGAADG